MSEIKLVGRFVGCAVPPLPLSGHVHSLFNRACNLELPDGRLVALLAPTLPRTPWGIRVQSVPAPFATLLCAGESFAPLPGPQGLSCLLFSASKTHLLLDQITSWDGFLPPAPQTMDLKATGKVVLDLLREHQWPGLGSLYAPVPTQDNVPAALDNTSVAAQNTALLREADAPNLAPPPALSLEAILCRTLHTAARKLAGAAAKGDLAQAVEAATSLVGLGNGLTPSGDDLLVGFLAGLRCLPAPDPAQTAFAQDFASALRPLAETRTTVVGKTFLLHAADGLFSENILNLTAATRPEQNVPERRLAAEQVLDFGASSGADTLAGLLLAWGFLPDKQ